MHLFNLIKTNSKGYDGRQSLHVLLRCALCSIPISHQLWLDCPASTDGRQYMYGRIGKGHEQLAGGILDSALIIILLLCCVLTFFFSVLLQRSSPCCVDMWRCFERLLTFVDSCCTVHISFYFPNTAHSYIEDQLISSLSLVICFFQALEMEGCMCRREF